MDKERIIDFLASQSWSKDYYFNFNRRHPDKSVEQMLDECSRPEELIARSFLWNETKEGFNFWDDVETEYIEFLLGKTRRKFDAVAAVLAVVLMASLVGGIWLLTFCATSFPLCTGVAAVALGIFALYGMITEKASKHEQVRTKE